VPSQQFSFFFSYHHLPRPRGIEKRVKMTHDAEARLKHSPADQEFLDGVHVNSWIFETTYVLLCAHQWLVFVPEFEIYRLIY
jgi:hypothetical protein